ncbi:MAG TPA: hypothetical protein VG994_11770 [Steroidobacteraceae bacterium]|nr:hypothetical protein [Steroidobacteraceae bacterium]
MAQTRPVPVVCNHFNNRVDRDAAFYVTVDAQTEIFRPIGCTLPT